MARNCGCALAPSLKLRWRLLAGLKRGFKARGIPPKSAQHEGWWPRPESNGHVPFGTTDFKSVASTSSATGPMRNFVIQAESQAGVSVKARRALGTIYLDGQPGGVAAYSTKGCSAARRRCRLFNKRVLRSPAALPPIQQLGAPQPGGVAAKQTIERPVRVRRHGSTGLGVLGVAPP